MSCAQNSRRGRFGGFVRYNFQYLKAVFGLVANYDQASLSLTREFADLPRYAGVQAGYNYLVNITGSGTVSDLDFGKAAREIRLAFGNFLPYVFAGVAIGRADVILRKPLQESRTRRVPAPVILPPCRLPSPALPSRPRPRRQERRVAVRRHCRSWPGCGADAKTSLRGPIYEYVYSSRSRACILRSTPSASAYRRHSRRTAERFTEIKWRHRSWRTTLSKRGCPVRRRLFSGPYDP